MDVSANPITDLSQVRWATREVRYRADDAEPLLGWHVIGETSDDPDPHVREVYDLHVQNAHDGDGGDCSAWLADMVARKLSESDTAARWQRDRAVEEVNRARARMRAIENAASDLLALSRDRNVCSPGPAYEVTFSRLSDAMYRPEMPEADSRPAMREEGL